MKTSWSYDSPLVSKGNTAADFLFVNLLYLLCCLPVLTIGAANAALGSVSLAFLKKEKDAGAGAFLRAFRENLPTALPSFLVLLLVGAFLCFDTYLLFFRSGGTPNVALTVLLALFLVIYALIYVQIFLVQAKFRCRFLFLFSNALLLSLAHPLRSLTALAADALPWVLFFFCPNLFAFLTPLWVLAYFSLSAHLKARLMNPVYEALAQRRSG